jgi:hypothetical protein
MKIIVATPRTGSTLYTRYLQLMNRDMTCLDEFFQYNFFPKDKNFYDIVTERLSYINDNHIIKILVGNEVDSRVWDKLVKEQIPIIIIKRKNIRRQILSFGISILNDIWVKYETHATGLSRNRPVLNNELYYKTGVFKKEWFDNIVNRLHLMEKIQNVLTIESVLYYEDIVTLQYSESELSKKIIPIKQNIGSDEELTNFFTNATELTSWINVLLDTEFSEHKQENK